jgi:hypothetical protein
MRDILVFNGDADGLCALQQLALAEQFVNPDLVTGRKRLIDLVRHVCPVARSGDRVTVLDVSFKRNADAVVELLDAGVRVRYFDHHYAGELPRHPGLQAHIDTSPEVCTSILVDRALAGAHRLWAVAGAFGDNVDASARRIAAESGLPATEIEQLRRLGIALNYNSYGEVEEDLFFHPGDLHRRLRNYGDPREFAETDAAFGTLWEGYSADLSLAADVRPQHASFKAAIFVLPSAAWARRVSGVLANMLASQSPDRAHALVVPKSNGLLSISVRAPLNRPLGAARLCMNFPGGGGREAAAGIDDLPASQLESFTRLFFGTFGV